MEAADRQLRGFTSSNSLTGMASSLYKKPRYAIVREVPNTFSHCISTKRPSIPIDVRLARQQHAEYVRVLKELVDNVIELPMDDSYPDSPFVEDTAVVVGSTALITHPGAFSRRGEVKMVRDALEDLGLRIFNVDPPGVLDGGDVLHVDDMLFVGVSRRTNIIGVKALASAFPDMKVVPLDVLEGLHLKSALTFIGQNTLVVEGTEAVQGMLKVIQHTSSLNSVVIPISGAANVLRVGNSLLYPSFYGTDWQSEYLSFAEKVFPVNISEFHKGDGGLTCLSIIIS